MKLCYVLPKYDEESAENFFHISNFLEELGKKIELYVVIEHCISKPNIANLKEIYILNDGIKNFSVIDRSIKLIKIYFKLYKIGVGLFFARSSLTSAFPLLVANRFLNINRAKIIFWSCGQDMVPLSYIPNPKNIKRFFSKIIAWLTFKGINYLATGPEKMVDYYHQNYKIKKNKILNLYNDISLDRFYPISPDEKSLMKAQLLNTNKKVILFVHTFNKSRGIDILPKIARKIKKMHLNVLILTIGRPGDYSIELNKIVEKEQISEILINLGKVSNKDIAKYYQIADLFIMPSRGEGFPRVLLESMSCKCPTIAFNIGGVANILASKTHEELLINKDDDELFINQSLKIINNDLLLNQLAEDSFEKVTEYSTDKIAAMYLDCLLQINKA